MTFLRWIFAFTTSWACCAACTPVAGSRIFARDLATADARFAALPSTLAVGFTPTPGAKRVFAAAELARIAKANGLELSGVGLSGVVADVCFELAMHRADVDRSARGAAQVCAAGCACLDRRASAVRHSRRPDGISAWRAGTGGFRNVGFERGTALARLREIRGDAPRAVLGASDSGNSARAAGCRERRFDPEWKCAADWRIFTSMQSSKCPRRGGRHGRTAKSVQWKNSESAAGVEVSGGG